MATRRSLLAAGTALLAMHWPRPVPAADPAIGEAAREIAVADEDGLRAAVRDARPGDHIVLADGDHGRGGPLELTSGGTAAQPVVVRSASPLGARLQVRLRLSADDIVVAGLRLAGGCAVAGSRSRVTHCELADTDGIALAITGGREATVAYCAFTGCRGRGLSIDPNGKAGTVSAPHVHHNYFADFVGREGDNSHEALQIGQHGGDAMLEVAAVVEDNVFERVSVDSETISVKSSGNIIRRNTFLDCRSRPTNRFGNRNRWHGNWIENCNGMWIYGADHEVAGNRVLGSRDGLCLMAGNTSPDRIRVRRSDGRQRDMRPHCQDVVLVGNEADRLVVGKVIKAEGQRFTMPALRSRIEGHVGPLELELQEDTLVVDGAGSASQAVRLAASDVGPGVR